MKTLGYYNGEIGELEEMCIPMCDRTCYFGDGIYDATHGENGTLFLIDEHIDRFFHSAELLKIKLTHSKQELKELLISLAKKVEKSDIFVCWQVSRGTAPRNHVFPDVPSNLWITITPHKLWDCRIPYKAILQEDIRHQLCHIKTMNLIANVLAAENAKQAGCQEAIFHRNGRVTEGTKSNVSILKDGVFQTAPTDHFILPGISRAHLIKHCYKLRIPVKEVPFTTEELVAADEIIISSSGTLCASVEEIDQRPVGGRAPKLLETLKQAVFDEYRVAVS